MSQGWIDARLDDAVGKETADDIRLAQLNGDVGCCVGKVAKDGNLTAEVIYQQVEEAGKIVKEGTLNEALNVFSMAILLEKKDVDILAPYPEDAFLDSLKAYSIGQTVAGIENANLAFPKSFQEFFRCLRGGKLDAEALRNYIEKMWYSSNREEAWYDSDKRSKGIYCGYWCFIGAAVAKIRGFHAKDFENCVYFPVDLL